MAEQSSLGADTGPADSVGFWMWKVCHEYQRIVDSALRDHGLTHLQFVLLASTDYLRKSRPEVTQSMVAELTEIGEAQISHLVKALKAKGWLRQEPGRSDPRARALSLTQCGSGVLEEAFPRLVALQNELWPEDGECDALTGHLRRILVRWTGKLPIPLDELTSD
jgi:DNA-binding MarR family transcriptional regulator